LTGATVTATVAESVRPRPSETVYVKLSDPFAFGAGTYLIVLLALILADPLDGVDTSMTVSGSPSGSESFARTAMVTGTSSFVAAASSPAEGG
jgi:hypothetical protein